MTTDDLPFDPTTVSRDPSDYTKTFHYRQQVKYRALPSPSDTVCAATIREGDLKRAHYDHQVLFEYDYGIHTWRVVAELTAEPPHPLVTIYAKDAHGRGEHGSAGVGP